MAAIREPDKEGQYLTCKSGVSLYNPRDRDSALSMILLRIVFFIRQSAVTRNQLAFKPACFYLTPASRFLAS